MNGQTIAIIPRMLIKGYTISRDGNINTEKTFKTLWVKHVYICFKLTKPIIQYVMCTWKLICTYQSYNTTSAGRFYGNIYILVGGI